MFIALTGLHCSGKSYFTDNLPNTYGYTIAKKNQLLEEIFKSDENLKSSFDSSNIWYNHKFESNPYKITAMIIEKIYMNKNIILDSVHSNLEWEIIKSLLPDAKLIEFISPKSLRENRWDSNYKLSDKDKSRINYWHNCKASSLCLISEVDWVLNGALPNDFNLLSFDKFLEYYSADKFKDSDYKNIYDKIKTMKGLKK